MHFECFNASSFLQTNASATTWSRTGATPRVGSAEGQQASVILGSGLLIAFFKMYIDPTFGFDRLQVLQVYLQQSDPERGFEA